jgi:hypothetical protein
MKRNVHAHPFCDRTQAGRGIDPLIRQVHRGINL